MNKQTIKIISHNVNGILNPLKRRQVLLKLKKEKIQVALLQETHLTSMEHEQLKGSGFPRVYHSSYTSGHRRGVAILISQSLSFEYITEVSDEEGRFIVVSGKIDGVTITFCNVYAPPGSEFTFYRRIFDLMIGATGIVICGGDWNLRLNPKMDSSKTSNNTPLHRKINALMSELGVIDLWRDFFPRSKDYTYYSCPHNVYSRIDYFFVFKRDRHRALNCNIGSMDLLTMHP